jgi:FeS assembly SUF system regulator
MLRLTRMTDYAILVLGGLAAQGCGAGGLRSSAELARQTMLGQPTVAKLVKQLVAAGLVESQRGVQGGCKLARPASAISLAEVIEAIEGPIALTACVDGAEEPCSVQNGCFMSGNWNSVNQAIQEALGRVTLAEMLDPQRYFPRIDRTADPSAPTPEKSVS